MLNNVVLMQKNTIVEKQCSVCGQVLPIFEFRRYKNKSGAFGYRGSCRACEKEQNRKRDQKRKVQLGICDNDGQEDNYRFLNFYKKVKSGL